jgi:hypothetical protein
LIDGNYVNLNFSRMGRGESRERICDKYLSGGKGSYAQNYRNHFMSFDLVMDGMLLRDYWIWEDDLVVTTPQGHKESIIRLMHENISVDVEVHTLLDGTAGVEALHLLYLLSQKLNFFTFHEYAHDIEVKWI